MPSFSNPQLFIITGSNGAGKSTYRQALFPEEFHNLDIFDGDIFYSNKNTEYYKKYKSSKEARNLANEALEEHFIDLVDNHIRNQQHFAYEGHFTGPGAWKIPERFKAEGFDINLIFCGLDSVSTSIKRVEIRVRKNGFHVNPLDIENNYYGNMEMLNKYFSMFNSIEILDTSNAILPVCSLRENEAFTPLSDENLPSWFKTYMPDIYALVPLNN